MVVTTTLGALVRLIMSLTVPSMVAGDLATMWRRIAAVTIVQPVEAATHLKMLIDPRLLPARFRLFRRMVVGMAAVVGDINSFEEVIRVSGFSRPFAFCSVAWNGVEVC